MIGSSGTDRAGSSERISRRAAADAPRKRTTKKAVAKRVSSQGRVSEVQTLSRAGRAKKAAAATKPKPKPRAKTEERVSRKAPTPIASTKAAKKQKNHRTLVVFIVMALGFGSSAAVGYIDGGQIDVNETIEARNERLKNNEANETDTLFSEENIPVQNTSNPGKADGGLKGLGTGGKKPEPKVPVSTSTATSSTASSTDLTASSTEAVASSTDEVIIEGEGEEGEEVTEEAKLEENTASSTEEAV